MRHINYLKYMIRHKWWVMVAGRKVGASLWLTIIHDHSKFRYTEWNVYAQTFYTPDGKKQYDGSPEFLKAWLEHIHRNKHHWQYWILRSDNGKTEALEMPDKYIREMVADWMGAGKASTGEWECAKWYMTNKHKIILAPYTKALVENILFGGPLA